MIIEGVATQIKEKKAFLVPMHDIQGKACSGCGMCKAASRGRWITVPEQAVVRQGDHVKMTLSVSPALSFAALLFPLITSLAGALLIRGLFPGDGWTLLGAGLFFFAGFLPLRFLDREVRKKARVEILNEGSGHEEGH